ncbi:MAG TPA: lysylphosphatidylglycerol synthase transmembrane domain-containing protein, partial [Polyangiaceae bacterium]
MTNEVAIPDKPAQAFWRRHGLKLVVSLIIAVAFALTLRRGGLPIIPPAEALRRVDIESVVIYLALCIVWNTVRATRWRHLLAPIAHVPLRRIVAVSWIGYAAILVLPLRAGEIVRPYMMRQKGRISMAAATGTVGAERIIDGLFITLLLGVGLQLARP